MSMTKPEAVTWSVVALVLAGVVTFAALSRRGRAPTPEPASNVAATDAETESAGLAPAKTSELLSEPAGDVGDLPCVERSGRAMKTSELRGKFAVVDCIFTSCAGTCPAMSLQMAALAKAVKGMDDVRLVSISIDPERDTVAALTAYADRYGADKDQWLFLRAEQPVLQELAFDRLKLTGSRDDLFLHSALFALLDRDGKVRAYYTALKDERWIPKLLADLAKLRAEPAK
jgi:protein SCO1/2